MTTIQTKQTSKKQDDVEELEFAGFEKIPSSTDAEWYVKKETSNYFDSMRSLNEIGLKPITYKKALSKLMTDDALRDSLKGREFYLKDKKLKKRGIFTIDEDNNFVEGKGESINSTVIIKVKKSSIKKSPTEKYPVILSIRSDEEVHNGNRFDVVAGFKPFNVAPIVVGEPKRWVKSYHLLRKDKR